MADVTVPIQVSPAALNMAAANRIEQLEEALAKSERKVTKLKGEVADLRQKAGEFEERDADLKAFVQKHMESFDLPLDYA